MKTTFLLAVLGLVAACSDPQCPKGRYREGDYCHLCPPDLMYLNGNCIEPDAGDIDAGDNGDAKTEEADAQRAADSSTVTPEAEVSCDACTVAAGGCASGTCELGETCQSDPDCAVGFCDSNLKRCAARGCAPSCPAGNPCTTTAECVPGTACDPQAKVCLVSSCAGGDLQNQAELKRIRYCQQVNGNLTMAYTPGTPSVALDLRYLKAVTGTLSLSGAVLSTLRLDVLESVGGDFTLAMIDAELLQAPLLTTVGGNVTVGFSSFTTVDLPKLKSIANDLLLQELNYANILRIGALNSVGGKVFASRLALAPWSSLVHLQALGLSSTVNQIGCSVCPDNASNRYMCTSGLGC